MELFKKYTFLLLALTLSTLTSAQINNPFKTISYDSVVSYEFQGDGGRLIEYCLKSEPDRISKSILLSKAKLDQLIQVLTSNSSYGGTTAACFDPHLAIAYYKDEKIVASIDICLDCNYLASTTEIPSTKNKLVKVDEEYSYFANGFSKEARKSIHNFCKEVGFTNYLKPLETMFDE